ncbi:MAG: ddrB-like ParB superfamily domain protein [Bacteriophage sp.]|jgi:N12 class adenine-specific DNA methylase|nr:MAG: ddrB-like ParB superfamily domain protein [Bacteriophage sp.]UVY45637.1 MAG: ddrB-like ParB superfamily domain protein [Bacteriophage sp.]
MPEEKDKIKKLYDTFVSDGYDMESEEDFRKNLLDSTKRKAAYDALVKDGYDMEPFEEFESNIGFGKERTSSQQSGNSASGTVEEPISPANEQTWQPTEKEKVAMLTETDRIMNDVKSHTQTFNERIDNMQEYGINPGLQTKEGKMIFNPESGKLEKTFLTPAGNRYYSKSLADMESFQYRQAADMSIGGQLRKANLRLQELKAKQEERASEVHKEWAEETENNKAPLAAILGAATYTPRQQSDKENRALSVAIRETEELIKNLEEQKDRENGVDVGFWRGFGRTMGDVRTWDFGMGDMRDAFTMMNADELKKENATEGEREAHDAMMGAIHEKQQAEERYSGNADFWNRAGVMTGYMPSFMLDFVLTGGGFNGLSSFSKGSTRLATKVISKETAEKMAQQGFKSYIKENGAKGLGRYATDWTIKALGTTADDLLVRAPLMANTVQAGKTTADIIDRKLGDVVVDENGNYDFSNDKTWGDAIWQSEANAIIENYSEMFGAHLDPVFTLGNMSKLANVVGAKRIGTVLSKADASALNGIMGQTHQMFNKMGMSDYVGEVSEEYYGQLWRTMLNLDDAYQQNPDGTRTNLFASGQFHGDIWGGMALSMGLMGAGKHTLSAANYTSMKHGVNKADAKVNELLGKEVWEPLKETLDLTTNENIGEVAELIAGDKDFTINEKAAVLDYMERSLNLRGFNLASMAQSRGGNRNESVQQANDSYLDGYNIISSQEMNDAKNMYEYQRARVADLVDESMFAMIEENPIAALEFVNGNEQWNDEDKVSVIDYINAKQVYNGMIQRVRDDIDGRIEQSNSMIDARVNRNTGMIQGATMKQDERKVYVISGKLVPYDDGSGVSVTDSDNSIIIRDSETGALEQVSPDAVLSLDESQDPNEQKELAEQAIVEQFAREAADKIDGKVTFNPGDAYTITGQDGSQMQVQIIANEDGIVDNGDGTVNVSDGVNIFPLAKETIQQQADAANLARVAQFEQQRTIENAERKQEMQEAERPQYALNDIVSLTDENGVTVRGNITADADADGKYEVFTEAPINGKRVNLFTRDELDNMLLEHNGVAFERPVENESNNGAENIPENDNNAPQNIPAMQRIPKDEQGNPLYEQADSDTAWDAIVEQTEGDEDMAQTVVDGMVADKEEALKKLEKAKSKGGNSIAEKIASEKERKAAIDAAKQELLVWQKIAGTAKRRKMEADDERRRIADEAAALRKAEEEKLRAEREEAERIEREALNGVPDMVDDKPQDARARGYRRMNGHKIDRQEPVQALQGKEVSVKFSDDAIVGGRVAVIDVNLLQPSHIQGVRNPLHFIDEAQPKERNDEASVLSARKIAGNIRPEEITSSVTAYTGAPTVNARGEAIQGNNRSDALRIMWENHPEQAALYKQYLKDHAEEFGLQAEDIEAMEHPVLVNMVDVDDAEAIRLGQYVAQDTESGGVERIKPKNALQRMGAEMRSFANLLLRTSDDEMSFAGLVDSNGANVLKWMSQRGFITPTQYKSAFDSKGNLTPESKNDLRGIMYQSIFKDGSTRLEEMFNVLPVKAQKAILATAFRDYDSPNSERMVDEIQNSVRAYYALSQDKMFAEAKNFKEARTAVESWKRQYQMDDVTGESYLPADNFSNFVLHLAAMYKGESQSFIQNTFGKIYDLIQGTQEETLFEQPDNTPRTLVQAIKETFNLDYNGQQRSNVLVGDTATSQRGQQGSNGTLAPRERVENRNGTTDDTGRTESIGGQSEIESSLSQEEMLFSDDTDNQLSAKIARRIEVQEDDWIESGKYGDTYKQTIIVDGTHKVIKVDAPDTKGNYIGSAYEYDGQTFGDLLDVLNYIDASLSLANAVAVAEKETDTTPTEKQKEAGNYKKGHVQVGTFNITIENPKGSVRSGIDTEGNKWETIMQNTYGYIRGTEGVDGDHIDVFLSDDIDGWNGRRVFVVDQYNEDGSFDEHKVMLGFNETDDAEAAYFANYDSDWANNHKTVVTAVNLEDFKKWIDSSHRKTKAFAEYKSVKSVEEQSSSTQVDRLSEIKSRIEELHKEQEAAHGQSDIFEEARIISEINDLFTEQRKLEQNNSNEETTTPTDAAYTITQAQYTTKRGKVLDMHLVKFNNKLRDTVRKHTTMFAKQLKGWWDKEKQGFMMRSKEDAERLAEYATDAQSQPPLSLSDLSEVNDGNVQFSEPQQQKATKQEEKQEYTPIWQYSVFVDKETGETTLSRDDVSGPIPIGDARFRQTTNSPEEMLDILRNPQNGMQEVLDAVGISLENKIKTRELDRKAKDEIRDKRTDFVVDKEMDNRYSVRTLMKMIDAEKQAVMDLGEKRGGDVYHEGNIIFLTKDSADKFANEVRTLINDMRSEQQQDNSQKKTEASGNRLVTDERYAELRERMRKKLLGQMNIGIDPEILAIGTEMAVYHLEKGSRKFAEYATAMIADLGDAIRPYLKAFYNGARDLPEVAENGLDADMTPYDEVQQFDVANFDKKSIDALATAETVTRETEVEQEAEIAQERIKKSRPARKKNEKKAVNSQQSNELGLFDDLIDNNKNNEHGLQRTDAERSEGLSANGNRHGQGLSRGTETGSESEQQAGRGTDNEGERTSDAVNRIVRPRLSDAITEKKNTHNNHSERGKDHAPTSVDARIEANIKAIELAKQLLESGERATEKQMQTLRKFSGWGGLGKAFNEGTSYAPNPIAKKLRELLGEKAYQEAVMSANSAYYTPAYVVDTLWDIAEQMGFNGGNILEGSAGIGNILGQMPTNISERSDIHAIEIDGTSGGILSLLYPDAKVEIQGFEQTRIPNGSVDLAITNVPFVTGLRVNDTTGDKDLSKKFHNIHDFCIAKNVRKLREGGLGIFITSNGTLDNSKKLRDWIVNEGGADFVGAFRMHNKTFGGAGVTSDIVVIRKRVNGQKSVHAIDVSDVSGERMAEYDTGETRKVKGKETPVIKQLSMDYNRYFIEHPENMAGEMHFAFEKGDTFRPTSKGLYPKQDKKQEEMLAEFVRSFRAEEFGERNTEVITDVMPGKKIGEVFVKDGKLYINSTASAQPLEVNANKVKGHTKVECFEAYTAIKKALAEVLSYQTENESDEGLKPLLDKLNKAYDDFVSTYGHFNKNTAIAFLRNDVDYANVFALEKFEETADEKGNRIQKFEKTDVFSKRVVEKDKEPTPANVKDGIIASIFKFGRVDIPYIAEQLGTGIEDVKKEIIESGYGFEDPVSRQMEASYQYLSGNIREKLRQAEENNENGEFDRNIKALQEVMPMEIPAHLIDFTLGSSWIDPKLYEDFVKERTEVNVRFTAVGGTWFMKEPYFTNYEKNRAMGVTSEMLGRTIMGHTLIEAAIQNRSITVSTTKKHYDGTTETITDKEATQACAAKIDEIRQDFKDWARQKMQSDPEMSERMERIYNDMFNNFVPMSIPDEFVPEYFGGASHKFKMRPHQGRAIVRGTQQPLLLAHEVGTGKTFTLISTAMEMRRLGTARKPMIVVQNATVGQFVASAKELYPNAKILTLEEADRSADGRKNFYAKIRYNDWDMIVVPQSTFEFIPDSEEREMAFVQDKIEEKMLILEQMKEEDPDGKNMITRQAEREIELLEEQLAGLADNASKKRTANDEKKRAVALQNAEVKAMEMLDRRTDDVENFDDMGIDALLVDEAHEYKHLGFATAMQRGVKGVDPSYSKKSQGVFLKTQAVLEKNNGRNVIFATGTPISNTAAEIWTFMRYLMPADTMKEYGIYYFDDFVRNFGNIQQMLEFTTSGKFKENNRFAGYVNLPELVRIWSGVSDTVLTKEAGGVKDKIPEMEGGKAQDLYLPQTRALRSIMKFVKSELEHYEQMSGKEKKENSHIPLTMYGIAKAAAVDARLVQSDAEDDQNSKTNEAVRQTLRSLKETADYKGTVAIFADNYQNKQSGFNLYDDIRNKLIAEGVPADEIVVMRSGMTVKKKLEIFEKVNRGEVRVILGSTFTLGTGVNIQERLHTLIHLDAPNRPMDYTQRNGRILRQGNLHKDMNKPVRILRFGVEDSLDVTAYQRLKTKGAIADSIMNGKQMMNNSMTNRVLEEEEDVFGDTVAQLSGSEYAMLKNNAEKNVRKYASRKKQWETDQTYIHNAKPRLKAFIKDAEKRIEDNGRCLEAVRSSFPDGQFKEIVTGKHRFTSVDTMDDFFKEHNKSVLAEMKQMKDGEISGEQKRELIIQIGDFSFVVTTKLTRKTMSDGATLFNDVERRMTYSCLELGIEDVPVRQNLLRNAVEDITDNVITGKDFAERLSAGERSKKHNEAELKELLSREGKPFEYEEELAQAKAQLEEYAELMKKELEEKEAKYAEMDASVETANNISASEEDDELKREGGGAYTDDEVSYENDPVAKLLGQSRRTAKQRREFAQRERQRMAERVEILAEKLHLDNVEIVTDASVLDGKKQRAKGFYSKSTGKITIVIPNHTSAFDVEQTLLHEAVAHYGLRQLFGEHFDTFLDNVFNNADENIRKRIVDMAAKNGWNFRKATEEYLASLAEQTEFENINASWWRQIKDFFLNMLHKIGFDDFRGVTLTDNELRYILWRSYENLAEPGRYRSILGEAADVAKQYELGVGNYSDTNRNPNFAADSNDELYRDGSPEMHERELARDRYERRVKTGMFQSQEALQDSMLGLKEAMQAILGQGTNIEDVDGFENAYLGENRLSSVNKAEADAFAHTLFKPMLDEVAKLARTEAEREELTDYMMAKHGLERNTYMRNEAINNGATNADQTDYAGLTALTGMDNVTDAETEAQIMVNDYEQAHDTADLWKKVNAVSKAILSKSYECGMMSKATFDKISDMYDFYIPLRGFDEKTSTEAYAYLTHKQSAFNAPIKKAEGRRSKADDPFANLQSMAEGAIMQGNRNKLVKQRFLNFALNHPSDLVSVSDIWVEYDTVTNEWKPVFPDNIDSTDTPEEVERKMLDFETKMKSLAQQYPDRYKHGKDTVNIPYRIVESRDMRQHQIIVKRGGRDYVITINGNPRAAQALNGQTNPDNDMSGAIGAILRAGENINRQLSAFYTTRNPDFIVSNFMRDMLYTNTMTWIRESPNYALRFHRNYMYANPVRIKQLLAKHRKGTLDMGNKTEAMFHQFMMNGGETGYANIRDIEQHKNDIRRELKKSSGKIPVKKAWDLLGERFDEYNRAVENCARFAAFMTSREMGRSIDRSIYDAKEISVNFNKKGSGAKFYDSTGQTKAGNASALVSGLGRSGYVFWNAAIQGTTNFGRQVKRHPAKSFTGIAAMFLLGAIVAYLGGDDDDDDDKNAYYNLPEYVRRSNILFRAGNSWVSIPLPVEYRAVYGMGELMISILNGKEHLTGGEIAESITGQVTQILPIDLLEGGGGLNAFVPSAYKPLWEAYVAEKSWTGMPLYKDTPWNKDMPEWTKAYKSANKYIVGLANVMNEATGGDSYTKGAIDFNPAKIEYMLNGYFGGVFGTIDKLSKTVETVTGNREYDPRSFLLANRLVKAGDERTEYRAVNNEYFRLKEEHDRLKSRLKHYEEDTDNDIFDYAEKIDFLYNSPEYERYEIFEDYRRDIDDLYNELNDTVDDEERKNIEAELNELKKEMIEEMNKTRK